MKKVLIYFTIVLLTAATSIAAFDYWRGDAPPPPGVRIEKLHSSILTDDRELIVHLPNGYDSTKRYPVAYVLDGSSEDDHVAQKFDVLSTAGYAPQTIVVGIPNMSAENRERYLTPPFMRTKADDVNSPLGEGDKFLKFMELELVPFVERRYATSKLRLFHGHSRGGLLVMYSLIYKPDLFQARFCYSAPFWRQENILINQVSEFLTGQGALRTFLFISAGELETDNIKNGINLMTESFRRNARSQIVWYSELTKGASHQNNSYLSAAAGIGKWCEYIKGDRPQRF